MAIFKPMSFIAAVGLVGLDSRHYRHVDAFAPRGRGVVAVSSTTPSLTSSLASTFRAANDIHRECSGPGLQSSRLTFLVDETEDATSGGGERVVATPPLFDPMNLGGDGWDSAVPSSRPGGTARRAAAVAAPVVPAFSALSLSFAVDPPPASARAAILSEGDFNPDTFRPVCAASDSFYRLLQSSTRAIVGDDNFSEYGPLIAGGLLRIRLELCVVESFFNEAVGPFVKQNGLNWILPLHETVETFLAGTIFALATTFILVGSTKLVQIIAFYGDLVLGGPCRLFGGFFFDRARGMPVTLDVSFFGFWKTRLVGPPLDSDESKNRGSEDKRTALVDFEKVRPADVPFLALSGAVKAVGEASKIFRELIEGLDLFVGRYLVLVASGYIIVKFIHFKVFPDFP
ncbi:hypothetical protein ACHAW5_003349 [Stephanodiscus triporus]|uniref:Uncharacterized protein n=1 Tax=Stephanodiscus triporus TaxID=2934178 RepID=A0ABD3N2V2_9STRA